MDPHGRIDPGGTRRYPQERWIAVAVLVADLIPWCVEDP